MRPLDGGGDSTPHNDEVRATSALTTAEAKSDAAAPLISWDLTALLPSLREELKVAKFEALVGDNLEEKKHARKRADELAVLVESAEGRAFGSEPPDLDSDDESYFTSDSQEHTKSAASALATIDALPNDFHISLFAAAHVSRSSRRLNRTECQVCVALLCRHAGLRMPSFESLENLFSWCSIKGSDASKSQASATAIQSEAIRQHHTGAAGLSLDAFDFFCKFLLRSARSSLEVEVDSQQRTLLEAAKRRLEEEEAEELRAAAERDAATRVLRMNGTVQRLAYRLADDKLVHAAAMPRTEWRLKTPTWRRPPPDRPQWNPTPAPPRHRPPPPPPPPRQYTPPARGSPVTSLTHRVAPQLIDNAPRNPPIGAWTDPQRRPSGRGTTGAQGGSVTTKGATRRRPPMRPAPAAPARPAWI